MNGVETPEYFLCPISLQIMKDPVTAVTGITYDRVSIEQWLLKANSDDNFLVNCPVTNQPLPRDAMLTPNHTLRRLIQCWCTLNSVDRIPTPQSPISKSQISKLLRPLNYSSNHPDFIASLQKLEILSSSDSNKANKQSLIEFGVASTMVDLLIRLCIVEKSIAGVDEVLEILCQILEKNVVIRAEVVESLTWLLTTKQTINAVNLRIKAVKVMRKILKSSSSGLVERLNSSFFNAMLNFINNSKSEKATNAALHTLIDAAQWARNRLLMITDVNAIHVLIELELGATIGKKATEMIFSLLATLCACADGRERFLGHAAGVAMVTKRLLRVSAVVDHAAVQILAAVARYSGTTEVVTEMLKVGAVSKLCMVLQADCDKGLKGKAREVLRLHSGEWNNSPCIQMYLITRYPNLQF